MDGLRNATATDAITEALTLSRTTGLIVELTLFTGEVCLINPTDKRADLLAPFCSEKIFHSSDSGR